MTNPGVGPQQGRSASGAISHPRAATRVAIDYFLRQVESISSLVDGDLFLGLVFIAMLQVNFRRAVGDPALSISADGALPDEARCPVSVLALANSLGLAYETARRYVGKLEARRLCRRVKGGWIVTAEASSTPAIVAVIERLAADLGRFIPALRAAGVDVDALR